MKVAPHIQKSWSVLAAANTEDEILPELLSHDLDPVRLATSSHGRGLEIGVRLAFRHPEYAQLFLQLLDRSITEDTQSGNDVADRIVRKMPLEQIQDDE